MGADASRAADAFIGCASRAAAASDKQQVAPSGAADARFRSPLGMIASVGLGMLSAARGSTRKPSWADKEGEIAAYLGWVVGLTTDGVRAACTACIFVWESVDAKLGDGPSDEVIAQTFESECQDAPDVFYDGVSPSPCWLFLTHTTSADSATTCTPWKDS